MSNMLLEVVLKGLEEVCKVVQCKLNCLCVYVGEDVYCIYCLWDNGFVMNVEDVLKLCGYVQIFDGFWYFYQVLVVILCEEQGE